MDWQPIDVPPAMQVTHERHGWVYHAGTHYDMVNDEWDWWVTRERPGDEDGGDEVARGVTMSAELAKRLIEAAMGVPHLRTVPAPEPVGEADDA